MGKGLRRHLRYSGDFSDLSKVPFDPRMQSMYVIANPLLRMDQDQKSRLKQQHDLAASEKEEQKVADLKKQMDATIRQRERHNQASKKRPNIPLIILLVAGVWGLSGLGHYYRHHNDYWFLVILSATLAVSGSSYLVYCLISKRTYAANYYWRLFGGGGEWVYRDEDPFTYWLYTAFLLFFAGVFIYVFFHLLITGSV